MFLYSFLLALLFNFCQVEPKREFLIQGFAQGTSYSIKYYNCRESVVKAQVDSIFASIDSSMSLYKPYSLIRRFNDSERGVKIDRHFENVVRRSHEISEDSGGSFDITLAALVEAWGHGANPIIVQPTSARIAELLECAGFTKVRISSDSLIKEMHCLKVDLNGIAQGYTVDVLSEFLTSAGINDHIVEVGGEVRVSGEKPDGTPFRVSIPSEAPDNPNQLVFMRKGALTTSGVGKGHHIDVRTGYPVKSNIISVTVFASDAITADGYDNVLMSMNIDDAIRFIEKRTFLAATITYRTSHNTTDIFTSSRFKELLN